MKQGIRDGCTCFAPRTTEGVANMELLRGPFRQFSFQTATLTTFSCQTEYGISCKTVKNSYSKNLISNSILNVGILSENLKIKIYKNTILLAALHGHKIWSLILREA
jgi:hypothetical protein